VVESLAPAGAQRRNAVRQEQETEANRGFDISRGELAERFIFALVTGIGIAVGARVLSSLWPKVVTANRFAQPEEPLAVEVNQNYGMR